MDLHSVYGQNMYSVKKRKVNVYQKVRSFHWHSRRLHCQREQGHLLSPPTFLFQKYLQSTGQKDLQHSSDASVNEILCDNKMLNILDEPIKDELQTV